MIRNTFRICSVVLLLSSVSNVFGASSEFETFSMTGSNEKVNALEVLKKFVPGRTSEIEAIDVDSIKSDAGKYGHVYLFPSLGYAVKFSKSAEFEDFKRSRAIVQEKAPQGFQVVLPEVMYAVSGSSDFKNIQVMPFVEGVQIAKFIADSLTRFYNDPASAAEKERLGEEGIFGDCVSQKVMSDFGKALGEFQRGYYDSQTNTTVSHGDLHDGNVFIKPDGTFAVIDSLEMKHGYRPSHDYDYFWTKLSSLFERMRNRQNNTDLRAYDVKTDWMRSAAYYSEENDGWDGFEYQYSGDWEEVYEAALGSPN